MRLRNTLLLSLSLFFTQTLCAEILFEGYYRIERKGKHVGYAVQRLAHDEKAKTKTVTNYIRTIQGDGEVYESVTATAKDGSAAPVKSIYLSSNTGPTLKTTANFKNGVPYVSFEANSASNPQNFKKGTPAPMLSAFLFYSTDIPKLNRGVEYQYTTFVEQRGRTDGARLSYVTSQTVGGAAIHQLVNDSLGQPVENFVSASGEPLGSRSMIDDLVCFWVPNRALAIGEMEFPTAQLTKIFGDLPEGTKNSWSKVPGFKPRETIAGFKRGSDPRQPTSSDGVPVPDASVKLPGRGL